MFKAFKYRIYPTAEQQKQIDHSISVCRLVYNLALDVKKRAYEIEKSFIGSDKVKAYKLSKYDISKQLKDLRSDYDWISVVNSQSIGYEIENLDKAFNTFFKGGGFPKFKKKGKDIDSFTNRQHCKINWDDELLTIPKIPNISIVLHRKFEGQIKLITITKTSTNKYYASVIADINILLPDKLPILDNKTIGIDLGINTYAVMSDGRTISNHKFLTKPKYDDVNKCLLGKEFKKLKRLSRIASRREGKGSPLGANGKPLKANQKKAYLKLAKQHEKIANKRRDFLQKESTNIVNSNNTTFCFETLKIKNMSKKCKAKTDENGKYIQNGQKRKSGLNRSIVDAGFYAFKQMVKYKSDWVGKNVLEVDTFYPSSKTCSNCGSINKELKLTDRTWKCDICNVEHDRDLNASINIKREALNNIKEIGKGKTELTSVESSDVSVMTKKGSKKQKNLQIISLDSENDVFSKQYLPHKRLNI